MAIQLDPCKTAAVAAAPSAGAQQLVSKLLPHNHEGSLGMHALMTWDPSKLKDIYSF